MELFKKIREQGYKYSDDLDWQMHLSLRQLMDLVLCNKEVRNSFKEWLDKQE